MCLKYIDVHRGVKSKKLSHKNEIEHDKRGPPRFSDNHKYPPQKNLAKTPRTPPPGFPTTVNLINFRACLAKFDHVPPL